MYTAVNIFEYFNIKQHWWMWSLCPLMKFNIQAPSEGNIRLCSCCSSDIIFTCELLTFVSHIPPAAKNNIMRDVSVNQKSYAVARRPNNELKPSSKAEWTRRELQRRMINPCGFITLSDAADNTHRQHCRLAPGGHLWNQTVLQCDLETKQHLEKWFLFRPCGHNVQLYWRVNNFLLVCFL